MVSGRLIHSFRPALLGSVCENLLSEGSQSKESPTVCEGRWNTIGIWEFLGEKQTCISDETCNLCFSNGYYMPTFFLVKKNFFLTVIGE